MNTNIKETVGLLLFLNSIAKEKYNKTILDVSLEELQELQTTMETMLATINKEQE
jgi:hypothetical protein